MVIVNVNYFKNYILNYSKDIIWLSMKYQHVRSGTIYPPIHLPLSLKNVALSSAIFKGQMIKTIGVMWRHEVIVYLGITLVVIATCTV